jgi:DMSO/TMAO reductase YedYZ molybdopterin-dependent catalytic subunit
MPASSEWEQIIPSVTNEGKAKLTRRELLKSSLTAGGVALVGFHAMRLPAFCGGVTRNGFQGGQYLGLIEFLGEGHIPMETLMGDGLDGRLYTDLTVIRRDNPAIPNEKFYVRTRASQLLEDRKPWKIKVGGLLSKPVEISMPELRKMSRPAGLHLMECSGNVRFAHFGMLSVADWAGARVSDFLDSVKMDKTASHVLISGFDRYPAASSSSTPGASWIFTVDELNASKAFLATEMNGEALTRDHGAPVRLVVPGWYGCVCIKWVDEMTLLGEGSATTSQMREFASRTMQQGVPELVKDYRPAFIEQAAIPIRVEKWVVHQKIKYRVQGIAWGGSQPLSGLEIRFSSEFNTGEGFAPVDDFEPTANDPWSFWTHTWMPIKPGLYFIQLRVNDVTVPSRRLDSGYYVRSVEITEI